MFDTRTKSIVLAGLLLVGLTIAPTAVAGTTNTVETDDGGTEAQYSGEVNVNGQAVGADEEVTVFTDGDPTDTVDTTLTDSSGQFGGPTAADQDERLAVAPGETDDEIVSFQVNGVTATIESFTTEEDGTVQVGSENLTWENGDVAELNLSVEESALDGFSEFRVNNISASTNEIAQGETVTVDADIENIGNATGSVDIELNINNSNNNPVDTATKTIQGDNATEAVSLSLTTDINEDLGERELTIAANADGETDDQDSVTVDIQEAEAAPTFSNQSTASTTITSNGETTEAVQVELSDGTNIEDGELIIAYGDDNTVAGNTSFSSSDDNVTAPLENTGGFPGEHIAYTFRDDAITVSAGDTIAQNTIDNNQIDNDTATVFDGTVTFNDQSFNDSTGELEAATADLDDGVGGNARFVVNVHPTDSNGNPNLNEFVGASDVLNGTNDDVTVDLKDSNGNPVSITEDGDFVATIREVTDGSSVGSSTTPGEFDLLPNADAATGFVTGGVSANATVTINDSPFFAVTNPSPTGVTLLQDAIFNITADIENTGDFQSTQDINLTITNTSNGNVVTETTVADVQRNAGNSDTVTFEDVTFEDESINGSERFNYTIESSNDTANGTLNIVETAGVNLEFKNQATASSTVAATPGDAGVVVEDVSSNIDSTVLVTFNDSGDNIIVGANRFNANELDGGDVSIGLENVSGFPGNHTAHVVPTNELSSDYAVNDTLSTTTLSEIEANKTATIYESTVTLDDADEVSEVAEVNLSDANLSDGIGDNTEFIVVIHRFDNDTVGTVIGNSTTLSGNNTDEPVELDSNITDRGVNDVIAMVHFTESGSDFGAHIPHARAGGFIQDPKGVTDNATATVREPQEFNVTDINPVDATVKNDTDFNISANVQNLGDVNATQDINLTVTNESGSSVVSQTQSLTLNGTPLNQTGEEKQVTFRNINISDSGNFTHNISSDNSSVEGNLTVIEEAISTDIEFNDQATDSSRFPGGSTNASVVVENVSANVDSTVLVTYDQGGKTIAGLESFQATELNQSDVTITIDDPDGFPGNHTARVVPTTGLSKNYQAGDQVSNPTEAEIDSNETATIFQSTVDLEGQNITGEAANGAEITGVIASSIDTANLLDGNNNETLFQVDIHETDSTGVTDNYIGSTEVLNGTNSDLNFTLRDSDNNSVSITESDEFVAIVHRVDNSSNVSVGDEFAPGTFPTLTNVDADDGVVDNGVADNASVDIDPYYTVDITNPSDDATITEGDTLEVTADIENTGGETGTRNITLTAQDDFQFINNTTEQDSITDLNLIVGENVSRTLELNTSSGDIGNGTVNISAENDGFDLLNVTVEEDTGGGGGDDNGGGGGGGGGGGASTDSTGGETDDGPATVQDVQDSLNLVSPTSDTETDLTDSDTEQAGLNVDVEGSSSVQRITFNNEELTGSVRVTDYGAPPQTIDEQVTESVSNDVGDIEPSEIDVKSVTDITPTVDATEDSSATVEMTVDADSVSNPSQLVVYKESFSQEAQADQWEQLETSVAESNDEQVVLEAQVDSFSLFAVAELPGDGEGQVEDPDDGQPGTDDDGGDDSGPGSAVIIGILLIVLAIAAVIGFRQMNTEGES